MLGLRTFLDCLRHSIIYIYESICVCIYIYIPSCTSIDIDIILESDVEGRADLILEMSELLLEQ